MTASLFERLADHLDGLHGECHCRRMIDEAEAVTPPALDVERLARALHEAGIGCARQNVPGSSGRVHHDDAAAIVAALSTGDET